MSEQLPQPHHEIADEAQRAQVLREAEILKANISEMRAALSEYAPYGAEALPSADDVETYCTELQKLAQNERATVASINDAFEDLQVIERQFTDSIQDHGLDIEEADDTSIHTAHHSTESYDTITLSPEQREQLQGMVRQYEADLETWREHHSDTMHNLPAALELEKLLTALELTLENSTLDEAEQAALLEHGEQVKSYYKQVRDHIENLTTHTSDPEAASRTETRDAPSTAYLLGLRIPRPASDTADKHAAAGRAAVFREEVLLTLERMRAPQSRREKRMAESLSSEQQDALKEMRRLLQNISAREGLSEYQYERLQSLAEQGLLTESLIGNMEKVNPNIIERASKRAKEKVGGTVEATLGNWQSKMHSWRETMSTAASWATSKVSQRVRPETTSTGADGSGSAAEDATSPTPEPSVEQPETTSAADTAVSPPSGATTNEQSQQADNIDTEPNTTTESIPDTATTTQNISLADFIFAAHGSGLEKPLPASEGLAINLENSDSILQEALTILAGNIEISQTLRSDIFGTEEKFEMKHNNKTKRSRIIIPEGTTVDVKKLNRFIEHLQARRSGQSQPTAQAA